jgi:hypothetical protein
VLPEIEERAELKRQTSPRNLHNAQLCLARAHPLSKPALGVLTRWNAQREIADLAQPDDEADVGKPFNEKKNLQRHCRILNRVTTEK